MLLFALTKLKWIGKKCTAHIKKLCSSGPQTTSWKVLKNFAALQGADKVLGHNIKLNLITLKHMH